MKRYLLFVFNYEANGGWGDFRGGFDSLAKAYIEYQTLHTIEKNDTQYFHIVDLHIGKIVMHSGNHFIPENLII